MSKITRRNGPCYRRIGGVRLVKADIFTRQQRATYTLADGADRQQESPPAQPPALKSPTLVSSGLAMGGKEADSTGEQQWSKETKEKPPKDLGVAKEALAKPARDGTEWGPQKE